MTTELYDYEFFPWRIDGDRRIVADEGEWDAIRKRGRNGRKARVRVPVDVFEEAGKAKVYDRNGLQLFISSHGGWSVEETRNPWVLTCDVVSCLYGIVDEFPNLTWMLETERPENVAEMKPPTPVYESATTGEMLPYWGPNKVERPNLWLYARCDTQAEADARIPHLLRCPAVVRGLVMEPREDVNLALVLGGAEESRSVQNGWHGIDHVIIRGGTEPLHPDNVRSIVRQCEAAGVPVWCESPVDGRVVKQLPEAKS